MKSHLVLLLVLQQCILPSMGLLAGTQHPCSRECVKGASPMTCRYHFKLEWYQSMSKACFACPFNHTDCTRSDCVPTDGVARPILTINRQLPGPAITVCLGDRVVVDLENALPMETTSIHWHGHHQRGSPHMDGVPHVTQCPVPPGTTFRYIFRADNPGTHFWHSHSGLQRGDGVAGTLVIRQSRDPHRELYDLDSPTHVLLITDWLHGMATSKFVGHHHGDGNNKPRSVLINGHGRFGNDSYLGNLSASGVPLANFSVTPGLRHRFRIVNSGFMNCPLELSVDNHTLLIIASDGSDVQPVEADSLVSYAGERFDFVLHANQPIASYWMRVRGLMDCDERFHSVHQLAVIAYEGRISDQPEGIVSYEDAARGGKQVNPLNTGTNDGDDNTVTVVELSALEQGDPNLLSARADHTIFLGYDFYGKDNPIFHTPGLYGFNEVLQKNQKLLTPQLSHISLHLPATPMIAQSEDELRDIMCNETSLAIQGRNCSSEFCHCLHRLRVEVGSILDLVLVDEGVAFDANHPFHLHGHAFHVIAMERLGVNTSVPDVRRLLEKRGFTKNKLHAPLKDTITVPDGGFTMLRLRASNPGVWLFHCHIGFHVEIGMGLILQVGDWSSFEQAPKGFPTCGNYLPSLDQQSNVQDEVVLLNSEVIHKHITYHVMHNITLNLQPNSVSPPSPPHNNEGHHNWPSSWWYGEHSNANSAEANFSLLSLIGLLSGLKIFVNVPL